MLTVKKLKQGKIFEISLSESRIYKKWQTSAITWEISDSNLVTGRKSSKSGVPGLSGRVDSSAKSYPGASFLKVLVTLRPGGGTLEISGWGCAAGTLEPLTYTRASSAEFCYPILE